MMLFTISSSHNIDIDLIDEQDAVLFWQNGVVLAMREQSLLQQIISRTQYCYVLDSDIIARGLGDLIDARLQVINMQDVVNLTAQYHPQIKW